MTRAMAHVEIIHSINTIENADALEVAGVLGWNVVVRKGEYQPGDKVCFAEIDSWVPYVVAPFLKKGDKERTYNGVAGERLRTIRLRGQLSQGLILPLPDDMMDFEVGTDVSAQFNIQKWEAPIHPQLAGVQRGSFPSQLRKTDQERIQNCYQQIFDKIRNGEITDEWIVQEKLEGSSMQVAKIDGVIHITSRNIDLKIDQEGNTFVDVAKQYRLIELLEDIDTEYPVLSIQGELIGPGIQGNIYNLNKHEYRIFDIWVGDRFLSVPEIIEFYEKVKELGYTVDMVPMHAGVVTGVFGDNSSVQSILKTAEVKSHLNESQNAEGLVYKNLRNPNITFKAISDIYLLGQK